MLDENRDVGHSFLVMERRARFRHQLERLEGAGSPRQAIDAGLYVERPRSSKRLFQRIELKPRAVRVIAGPIGSGKSTELMVLANALSRLPDLWATVLDVSLVHDLVELREGTLIAAAAVLLQNQYDIRIRDISYRFSEVFGAAVEDALSSTVGVNLRAIKRREASDAGVLRPPGDQKYREIAAKLREAVLELMEAPLGTPVLLFDSLDRVRDAEGFRLILERDVAALLDAGFGVILTAPVTTLWSHPGALRSLCESWDTMPYEDPAKDQLAFDFLLQVLERRADPTLLGPEQQRTLVLNSGGVLRDMIELARNAVEEAYMSGRDSVSDEDTRASIARFARGLTLGLTSTDIVNLRATSHTRQVPALDEATLRLLENRQLLEHQDPTLGSYFEPHPTLAPILAQQPF